MANKYEAGKRFLRVMIPTLGLMVIASACSSAPEPSVSEIRDGLPKPGIAPGTSLIYTNQPDTGFTVDTENLYKDHPDFIMSPEGATAEWVRENWFNPFSPKNKLQVTGLPIPNTTYTISLQGENCTKYKGDLVCTDPIKETVNIVYDTIPPQANVTGFESRGAALTIRAQISDNLSGPEDGNVEVTVKNPKIGNNSATVEICDNAENCTDATVEGSYDPFSKVISMQTPRLDPKTGLIVVSGTINNGNDNIDLSKTDVSAKQSLIPEMAFDLDKVGLDCGVPEFNGFNFNLTCEPKATDGRSIVKITIKDKLGNRYVESYEVEIPPLSRKKANLFYSLLTLAFLTDAGLFRKVRGDRVRRERRAALATALANGNRGEMIRAKNGLVKRDKKEFTHIDADFNMFEKAEAAILASDPVKAIVTIKDLYKRPPHLLSERREELLSRAIGLIKKDLREKDWKVLDEGKTKEVLNFIWTIFDNANYNFFWSRVGKIEGLKTLLVSAVLLSRSQIRGEGSLDFGDRRLFFGLGLNNPEVFFGYFNEMVQWGDYKTMERLIGMMAVKYMDKRVIQTAFEKLDKEQEKVVSGLRREIDGVNKFPTTEERLRQVESIKAKVSRSRFTDVFIAALNKQIAEKESEFKKAISIGEVVAEVKGYLAKIVEQDWSSMDLGLVDSGIPEKSKMIVESIPGAIKDLMQGEGDWYRYAVSKNCPPEAVKPLLKALILQELMPYALLFGTNEGPDDGLNFYSVMPFNLMDRDMVKMFAPLINAPNQDSLSPGVYYLRRVWDRAREYKNTEKTAADLGVETQDILLAFDNRESGKLKTMMFYLMAMGVKFNASIGMQNIGNLAAFYRD